MRLSVSAIRDYQRCGRYFYFKRIRKLPDPMSHHAPAGSLIHSCYYAAHAIPSIQGKSPQTVKWTPTGHFNPELAMSLFHALWDGTPSDDIQTLELQQIIQSELSPVANFRAGQLKSLGKGQHWTQAQLKEAWGHYYATMLQNALQVLLPYPIAEIERKVTWKQGDAEMLGFIDLVLDAGDTEVGIDLKTGYNKPSMKELSMDDQMHAYFLASKEADKPLELFYYWHMKSGELLPIRPCEDISALLQAASQQVAHAIQQGDFKPRYTKDGCAYCTYLKACIQTSKGELHER